MIGRIVAKKATSTPLERLQVHCLESRPDRPLDLEAPGKLEMGAGHKYHGMRHLPRVFGVTLADTEELAELLRPEPMRWRIVSAQPTCRRCACDC
jgi:hypothetical protein